jgi:SAM-dependent methyltransferase
MLDVTQPNVARVYDYLIGGRDNFEADRALAQELEKLFPPLRAILAANRAFIGRVTTWAALQGIGQFLDLGAGLPTSPAVHEVARDVIPGAHVVYVDNDQVARLHASALLATRDGVVALLADLTEPATVLSAPALQGVIDLEKPVCVLLACVLHFMDADVAREVVAGYARLLAPGSVVAVSVVVNDDDELWEQMQGTYTAGSLYNHSRDDLASFLGALEMVPPGIALAHAWRGGMPDPGLTPGGPAYVLAAVARKT